MTIFLALFACAIIAALVGAAAAVVVLPIRMQSEGAAVRAHIAEMTDKLDHAMKRQAKRDRDASPPSLPFDAPPAGASRSERAARLRAVSEHFKARA